MDGPQVQRGRQVISRSRRVRWLIIEIWGEKLKIKEGRLGSLSFV